MKLLIAVGVIALMVGGFLFVKGPSPVIIVAPEHIFDIAGVAVTNTMFSSWIVVGLLCLVAIIAGLAGWGTLELLGGISQGSFAMKTILNSLVVDVAVGLVMLFVYLLLLKLLRVREIENALTKALGILRR